MLDVREKTHRANQGERPDIGVWKGLMKSRGDRKDGAALGDHVVDQHNSSGRARQVRHRERLVVLLRGGTICV
jgi:hypothetical protein